VKEGKCRAKIQITHSARLMKKVKMLLEVLSTPSIIFPFGVLRNFLIAEANIS